jgi:hypothetical protein
MGSSAPSRTEEIGGDLAVVFVTIAQLIFFAFFHRYISWPVTQPDGTVTRLSMLTDGYFTWLPFPITASILVVVVTAIMIIVNRYWFRQATWILFCILGIMVTSSLLVIFPFDFSVLPNARAVEVVPTAVRVFFILLAVFYGVTALVMLVQFRKHISKKETE